MTLRSKIESNTAIVGVIGLGYVGLPLLRAFFHAGFPVLGFDIDQSKIDALKRGRNYLKHLGEDFVKEMSASPRFSATADFGRLGEADVVISCVPTPLGSHLEPDLSFVEKSADDIAKTLRKGQLIVLESSTYPRTTREVMLPRFEARGLKCGEDFYLAYSPEREDPGRKDHNTQTIPKLVGGIDPISGELATNLYRKAIKQVIPVSTAEVAEAAKILENVYRAVNIALVNEMKTVLTAMGIDVWEVIAAASSKPFGFQAFYPGPGLGGHCLDGHEVVAVRRAGGLEVIPLAQLFDREAASGSYELGDVEGVPIHNLEALCVDPASGKAQYSPVTHLFRRPSPSPLRQIRLRGNRRITVTDGHPMLVHEVDSGITVRRADQLVPGDRLILMGSWPEQMPQDREITVDLIDVVRRHLPKLRVRVMPRAGRWEDYALALAPVLRARGEAPKDVYRHNTIALDTFLALERQGVAPFGRSQVLLATGRGASWNQVPARLTVDEDVARLIGYYLSEGCVTADRSLRVRLAFGSHESELLEDVKRILDRLSIRHSVHHLSTCATTQVKISSSIFAALIRDEWQCGVRSEDAAAPAFLLNAAEPLRRALLTGLFRGDGDVDLQSKTREYRKRGRTYRHRLHAVTVGYFTSSPKLLQQVTLLLHGLGLFPLFHRNRPHLRLCGRSAMAFEPLLVGSTQERLVAYREGKARTIAPRSVHAHGPYGSDEVVAVEEAPAGPVYSMEVEGTHTFVTSYGIAVHNCIPIDPYYLTWKAREVGLPTRFIELAGEVNRSMPDYVVSRVTLALNDRGKAVKGARVLVLGLAYKPDVDDVRESPSFELIEKLEHLGAQADYNDPLVPKTHRMRRYDLQMSSVPLNSQTLRNYDCILIATNHSSYDWQMIADHAKLIVDTRGVMRQISGNKEHIISA